MTRPRIGSLFSGYGGLERGVQEVLGGTVAWHSEIDPGACKILAHRYPDVPNLGDITAVDWSQVEPVDVLTGGFPCQDVSAAGKRKGIRPDTRSGLWSQFAYAIDQLRPGLVVIENVRGLLSADAHHPAHGEHFHPAHGNVEPCPWCVGDGPSRPLRALGAVLGELADLGYDASWQGLRASDVGAPHGRFRVFVVAWPAADAGSETGELGTGLRPDAASRLGRARLGHGSVVAADAGRDRLEGRSERDERSKGRVDAPQRNDADGRRHTAANPNGDSVREQPVAVGRRSGAALAGLPGADVDADAHSVGLEAGRRPRRQGAQEPGDHDRVSPLPAVVWGQYADAVRRWERLTRPAPRPTETGTKGAQRLSPAFVEWMQGLPAGWVTDVPGLSRNDQLKALGNGVVPQQAAAALRMLLPDALGAVA